MKIISEEKFVELQIEHSDEEKAYIFKYLDRRFGKHGWKIETEKIKSQDICILVIHGKLKNEIIG